MGWLFGCFGYSNKRKRLKPFHINHSRKKGIGSYQTLESLLLSELPKGRSSKPVHSNLKRRKPGIRKKVRFDLNVIAYEPAPVYHDDDDDDDDDLRCILEENSEEEEEEEEDIADFLECARNSVGMKRERNSDSSYRYGNCYDQEEEEDGLDSEDDEDEIEEDEELETIHESLESDTSDRCCVNPVLMPIENLTQWRAIKTKRWEIVARKNRSFCNQY